MIRKFSMATAVLIAATGSALAADLPSRRPPPPVYVPPPLFTWTGFYVGGDIGYGWGTSNSNIVGTGFSQGNSPSGVVGGAHVGYNYQVNQFVIGVEGDVSGTSFSKTIVDPVTNSSFGTRIPIEGSVRGRVGYAWDRALFYATGGAAFADLQHTYSGLITPFNNASFSTGRVGWTVGGGIEYALTNNWSVRGEYRYSDFGRSNDIVGLGVVSHRDTEHAVRVGFSYKFDMYAPPAPVLAKY